jgi:hypothetical protein
VSRRPPSPALRSPADLDSLETAFLLAALALAGCHVYLGALAPFVPADRAVQFLVIGLCLLVGPVLYFTPYWRPVLYLLGAVLALSLGVVWALGGMAYPGWGLLAGVAATGVVLLGVVLFVRATPR